MENTSPSVRCAGNIFCLLVVICAFGGSVDRENPPVKYRCRCRANVSKLKKATPDDLVLIFFSSHGLYRKINGRDRFYFLPYDIGPGKRIEETPSLFEHSISNEELAAWLKDVDAGEMVLVADACQ